MKGKIWTEEEVKYLKEKWADKKVQEIADDINKTYNAVYMKARNLNLGPSMKGSKRLWTKEEEMYLEDNWGYISKVTLAKNLKRSMHAINVRAFRLKLGPFIESGDYITLNQLICALHGVKKNNGKGYTIQQWIDKGLQVKNKKVQANTVKVINLEEWWDWAEMNSTLIDFSKLKPLILGKEPKWLEGQREADKENSYFIKTPWTENEDTKLRKLLMAKKYTYREISIELKRTEGAIKRRVLDLKITLRPIRMSNHNPWAEKETDKLIELYHKGHCRNTIPNYIDRSSQACSGKIERLIREGVIYPRSEFRSSC